MAGKRKRKGGKGKEDDNVDRHKENKNEKKPTIYFVL